MARVNGRLRSVVYSVLRGLARLLLRTSLSVREFLELSKLAFVDAAYAKGKANGRMPSVSAVSRELGLTRREVARLREILDHDRITTSDYEPSPQGRVLHAWHTDARYVLANGDPRPLPRDSEDVSLANLIEELDLGVPAGTLIESLIDMGSVTRNEPFLPRQRHQPPNDSEDGIAKMLDLSVSAAMKTLEHNIDAGASEKWVQRLVFSHGLAAEELGLVRRSVQRRAAEFCEGVDDLLAAHERPPSDGGSRSLQTEVGIGIFYFEERSDAPSADG